MECRLTVKIIGNQGIILKQIYKGMISTGRTDFDTDIQSYASGVYWIIAECGNNRAVKKIQITK